VRAREVDHGERLGAILASYALWKPSFALLIDTVIGDASKPLLRVSEEEFHHLADRDDSIRHAGALVDLVRPLSNYLGQEDFKWSISHPRWWSLCCTTH
jgi:thioester reductase-like protein